MINSDSRIPDDMAGEVLAEATRLYAQASKGYSVADLQQACSEVNIPSHIISQAIKNVEEKRANKGFKQQQLRNSINKKVKESIFFVIIFIISAVGTFSIISQLKPVAIGIIYKINPNGQDTNSPVKILKVQEGKLEYLNDRKGLSIAVRSIRSTSFSDITGVISTDGYQRFTIESGQVGDSFKYQGVYKYSIKIIEVNYDSVTFQIEQLSDESQSAQYRFEEKIKQIEKEREILKTQVNDIKTLENNNKLLLEQKDYQIKLLEQEKDRLRQENVRLKLQVNFNQKNDL